MALFCRVRVIVLFLFNCNLQTCIFQGLLIVLTIHSIQPTSQRTIFKPSMLVRDMLIELTNRGYYIVLSAYV